MRGSKEIGTHLLPPGGPLMCIGLRASEGLSEPGGFLSEGLPSSAAQGHHERANERTSEEKGAHHPWDLWEFRREHARARL